MGLYKRMLEHEYDKWRGNSRSMWMARQRKREHLNIGGSMPKKKSKGPEKGGMKEGGC